MVKVYKERKWESYDPQAKGELYLVLTHFLKTPQGFVFGDYFKESYMKYFEVIKGKSIEENEYKGYLGNLAKMSYFEHENRDFGKHPDNRVYLNKSGYEFFFLFKNEILSYGKEKKLDLYLNPFIRTHIPGIYLNEIKNASILG